MASLGASSTNWCSDGLKFSAREVDKPLLHSFIWLLMQCLHHVHYKYFRSFFFTRNRNFLTIRCSRANVYPPYPDNLDFRALSVSLISNIPFTMAILIFYVEWLSNLVLCWFLVYKMSQRTVGCADTMILILLIQGESECGHFSTRMLVMYHFFHQ